MNGGGSGCYTVLSYLTYHEIIKYNFILSKKDVEEGEGGGGKGRENVLRMGLLF